MSEADEVLKVPGQTPERFELKVTDDKGSVSVYLDLTLEQFHLVSVLEVRMHNFLGDDSALKFRVKPMPR